MREILFRGQTRKKGEKVRMDGTPVPCKWVYGGICQGKQRSVIYGGEFEDVADKHIVYSETVGQYVGLTDKNGTKIFEDDIVEFESEGIRTKYTVIFVDSSFYLQDSKGFVREIVEITENNIEVIGNIHEREVQHE